MIVNKILGNIKNFKINNKSIIKVKINPDDRLKKILRLKADNGIDFGINLDDDIILKDGDILDVNDKEIFIIQALPQDVIIIKPKSITQMGFIAHFIGNKHTPAIFENDEIIVEYDYLLENWLNEQNISFTRDILVLDTPLKHATHHH